MSLQTRSKKFPEGAGLEKWPLWHFVEKLCHLLWWRGEGRKKWEATTKLPETWVRENLALLQTPISNRTEGARWAEEQPISSTQFPVPCAFLVEPSFAFNHAAHNRLLEGYRNRRTIPIIPTQRNSSKVISQQLSHKRIAKSQSFDLFFSPESCYPYKWKYHFCKWKRHKINPYLSHPSTEEGIL